MECVCFESASGDGCKITFTSANKQVYSWVVINLLLLIVFYVFWPAYWLLFSIIAAVYTIYHFVPQSECVEAIGGLGLYITRSFGKVTTSSLFIPQTILQNIIIFEAVSKYRIDFALGVHVEDSSIKKDLLVPLFKVSGSLSLKQVKMAYKPLIQTFERHI